MQFDLRSFTDVDPKFTQKICDFLCRPEIFARLETATYFKYPAVAGISNELDNLFGLELRNKSSETDRRKQMIGFLVRQLMEKNGYTKGINIPIKIEGEVNIFSTGTVYRK